MCEHIIPPDQKYLQQHSTLKSACALGASGFISKEAIYMNEEVLTSDMHFVLSLFSPVPHSILSILHVNEYCRPFVMSD